MCRNRHIPSKPEAVSLPHKKARQARGEHRGHVSKSAHFLEAGSRFLAHIKARQARGEHRGHVSRATHSLEAGSNFPTRKKRVGECHSPTLFCTQKNCSRLR
ncbi:MAG: hypothetical protein FWF77_01085, partial [Defluviitaleaceae bacterium]|nr:hypothetical protein [Defluviitaleaceae bacterium]